MVNPTTIWPRPCSPSSNRNLHYNWINHWLLSACICNLVHTYDPYLEILSSIWSSWNEELYVATFQQQLHVENISVSCHVFIDRGLLPTMKLQNQVYLVINMKSSLRKFYYPYHDLVNCRRKYLSQMTTDMLVVEVFTFMAYRQIFGMINISVPLVKQEQLTLLNALCNFPQF